MKKLSVRPNEESHMPDTLSKPDRTGVESISQIDIENIFQKEEATYERELPQLLELNHEGEYALIYGDTLKVLRTLKDAEEVGYREFGMSLFMIRQILASEPIDFVTSIVCP